MSFNILRFQVKHSIQTFGIRCLPSFKNKTTLIATNPFVIANAKLITNLSRNSNVNKTLLRRQYNTSVSSRKSNTSSRSIAKREKVKEWSEMTAGQKVVGAAKVTTNISIIAVGVGIFGVLIYLVLKELFSSSGSTKVLGEALEKIRLNPECQKVLGLPIKGHGGSSSSGRRRNRIIRLQEVINTDGTKHKLMKIYLEGSIAHGTALLDMIKNDEGTWTTKYLIVSVPEYSKRIFVEYNDDVNKDNDGVNNNQE